MKKRLDKDISSISSAWLASLSQAASPALTKFAAIGFSNALRLNPYLCVYVTTVNPGPYQNSLFFDLADPDGSYVKAVDKYIRFDFVAGKIVNVFGKKSLEIALGFLIHLLIYTLFPRIADK